MNNFVRQLVQAIQDENTSIAEDALSSAEFTGYIDTGSYLLNAQLSGTIYGGLPNTKNLVLAGEQAVGKTFLALGILKHFLQANEEAFGVWYLAEPAVTRKMLVERGIDPSRVIFSEPVTVHQWANHVVKTIDSYMETPEKERPPMLIVLDSLGNLSSEKEVEDLTKGEVKRDMTRQQNIRGAFRVLSQKVAKAKSPIIITNHVYQVIGSYVPTKEIGGGGGAKYASDIIAVLSSSKKRDGQEVTGSLVKITMDKNRIAKQNTKIEIDLSYTTGLNRYYGLLELAEEGGLLKKSGAWWQFPDGTKSQEKTIFRNPEKYFTKEFLDQVDRLAKKKFEYGRNNQEETTNENTNDDSEQSDSE